MRLKEKYFINVCYNAIPKNVYNLSNKVIKVSETQSSHPLS